MLLKFYFKIVHNLFFYRKIEIKINKDIPYERPIIFAPNHQNALMDPLAVIATTKGQSIFLARADIFKNPRIASILYYIKILPVYRMRDGITNLQKNDEVFDRMVDILKQKKHICILPEGNHDKYRRLRPLAKGLFRIAFKTEEDLDFKSGLCIIPVGIDYSDFYKAQTKLLLQFGDPIYLADYKGIYDENPQKAILAVKNELSKRMSELMIDIQTEEYYDCYMAAREIYTNSQCRNMKREKGNLAEKFILDKKLIKNLNTFKDEQPMKMDGLNERVMSYMEGLTQIRLRDWLFNKDRYSLFPIVVESILLLLISPIFLYGLLHHYLPYKIPVWMFKAPKDPQFTTSFRFATFALLILFYYILLFGIVLPFLPFWWLRIAYALSMPLFGYFTIKYYSRAKKLWGKWRYTILKKRKETRIEDLSRLRKEILTLLDHVMQQTG